MTRRRSWRGRRGPEWARRGPARPLEGVGAGRCAAAGCVFLAAGDARRQAGEQGCGRAGGLARDIYLALPCHAPWRGSAAPRSVARQSPATSTIAIPVVATSALCRATMHGAAQKFGRPREIGVAKSVS